MGFTPKFDDFRIKVAESFSRQEFMKLIGAKLVTVKPGYCEIEIPYRENLTQQHGFFHAGIVSTLADNASGYAAFSLMAQDSSILTVEFKLNLLAPADGDALIGKAEVLKNGRTLTVCRCDVFVRKQGSEILCAAAQSTLIELKDRADTKE
jgi:uncharacterized protein (TIGR00369 family)